MKRGYNTTKPMKGQNMNSPPLALDGAAESRVNEVVEELRDYMLDFADPRATSELNEDLNEKSFASLAAYYKEKPEMALYTIEHEGETQQLAASRVRLHILGFPV